jgi:hypothetical protein
MVCTGVYVAEETGSCLVATTLESNQRARMSQVEFFRI